MFWASFLIHLETYTWGMLEYILSAMSSRDIISLKENK